MPKGCFFLMERIHSSVHRVEKTEKGLKGKGSLGKGGTEEHIKIMDMYEEPELGERALQRGNVQRHNENKPYFTFSSLEGVLC